MVRAAPVAGERADAAFAPPMNLKPTSSSVRDNATAPPSVVIVTRAGTVNGVPEAFVIVDGPMMVILVAAVGVPTISRARVKVLKAHPAEVAFPARRLPLARTSSPFTGSTK
jgi:hypothetical protein